MHRLTLMQMDGATALVLPEEMLARFSLQAGTQLYVVDTPDGVLLTPYAERTRKHLEVGREFLHDHDSVLRTLTE